ncbi:NAD-dependent epimerase/dehydratase family protein [soil metagenome]
MSVVAVTGAGGYLGSRLVADRGRGVRALVRSRVPYLGDDQVEVDLLAGGPPLVDALAGVSAVVHLAGHNEVVAATDPDRALTETLVASRRLAEAAAAAGVARLVYVSTVHVYGTALTPGAVVDETTPAEPRSVYAVARLASEHLLAASGVPTVVLRLTNAVGAPTDPAVNRWTLVATDLCRSAVRTGELVLRSSGMQWRDFVALDDVTRIIGGCVTLTGEATSTDVADPVPAGTYNLGSGTVVTVRALAEIIQERFTAITGKRPDLHAPAPDGPGDEPFRVAVDRLAGHGWAPQVPLADAVDELIHFCLKHEDVL